MDPILALGVVLALDNETKNKKKCWSKRWFLERHTFGHGAHMEELRINQPDDFRNFLQMDEDSFKDLLRLLKPFIGGKNTKLRDAIPPMERLLVTLRFLATGNTF